MQKDLTIDYNLKTRIIIAVIFTVFLLSTLFFKDAFVNVLNFNTSYTAYENNLYVNFVDVGQGKSIAVRFDDGKSLLVDCGPKTERKKFFNFLSDKFLTSNCNNYIDYFIITHGDSDHIGNAEELLKKYQIKKIYLPIYFQTYMSDDNQNAFSNLIDLIEKENCEVDFSSSNQLITGNDYSIKFLSPTKNYYNNENDYSTVLKIEYKSKSFLLTGDASSSIENELINSNSEILNCDVLDISHHGSNTASSTDFLLTVSPEYAVISYGKNNYDLPSDSVIERLNNVLLKEKILTTFELGHICFNVNQNGELSYVNFEYVFSLKTDYLWLELFIIIEVLALFFVFKTKLFTHKLVFKKY